MYRRRNTGSSFLPSLCWVLPMALALTSPATGRALPKDEADLTIGAASKSTARLGTSAKTLSTFDLVLTRKALDRPALTLSSPRDDFDGAAKGGSKAALSLGKATGDRIDLTIDGKARSRPVPKRGKDPDDLRMTRGKYQIRDALVTTQRKRLASPDRLATGKATLDRHDLDLSVTPKNVYHLK